MRNGQNNKRMRGRNNHHHHNNRKNQNPLTRVYESNGPDVKIRGTASHVAEKYVQLARDASTSGDPVTAENFHQHAEHYFRLIAAAQEQFRQQNPYYRPENETQSDNTDGTYEDADDGASQPMQGQQNFGNQQPPYPPRDAQPYPPREQPQPSFGGNDQQPHQQQGRPQHQQHQHRHQHQPHHQHNQPHQQQPQQSAGVEGNDVERLPSFITGGGQPPQNNNQNNNNQNGGYDNQGGDRYQMHRRRRRHRGHHRQDAPGGPQGMSGSDAPDNSRPDSD